MLKIKGEFYLVHRPERLAEIIFLLKKYQIEPKVLRMVYPKKEKEANLLLIKGIKGANAFLKVVSPLIIYHDDGTYTQEILKIYHKK